MGFGHIVSAKRVLTRINQATVSVAAEL